MKRQQKLLPSELNPIQRKLYDDITKGRRNESNVHFRLIDNEGRLEGPFNFFVMHPGLGTILSTLGEFIRYESMLPSRLRELLILCIAVEFESEFEWYAHKNLAINAGISTSMINLIREGKKPDGLNPQESVAYDLYEKLKIDKKVSDDFFSKTSEYLDAEMIFEVISLVGYYSTIAMLMNAFSVTAPDGEDLTFLPRIIKEVGDT